ncbi:KH domain-containing protein HEN4 isoform X2 [Mercurialis annua]|uniref:KH domain-containing protein HEN4 isoform X2 n=1 Tax=Mercurialis annua TaxID=3986 RepID=UPI00215F40BB|nr:KH domain-containing protein HEN4 isoform X2 [Mercurialis annua]
MERHNNRRTDRPRPPPQPIVVQPGQVAFRVVCHTSIIGGLIGNHGSVISQIRRDTGCILHCEELVGGSVHRVIMIVGPAATGKTITLNSANRHEDGGGGDGEEEVEKELVTVAQEAVIRVCERMWEVEGSLRMRRKAAKGGGDHDGKSVDSCFSEGYCGLLADTSQIGAIVGRAGNNVTRMKRESGAQICVLQAPLCASISDSLIQITGSILAVKKALVAVTECLHDCPPYGKDPMLLARPRDRASNMSSSDPHEEFFPHLSSLLPSMNGNGVNSHSLSSDVSGDPNQDGETAKREVSYRLICSNGAAGSIIGTKGSIVRTLQNESGASIMFAAPLNTSGERVVTISALEDLESWYSPAQNAVVLVFARSIEHNIEKGYSSGLHKGATVTARLLVASVDVCCLNGKDSNIDSELIEASGADIQILEAEQILDCASEHDVVVVEITGEYENVQNALFMVTGKLRNNLLPKEVLNEGKARSLHGSVLDNASLRLHQSAGPSLDSDRETTLIRGMNQLGFCNSLGNASPGLQSSQFGREHTTAIKHHDNWSTTSGQGSEFERSLNSFLPKEVLYEVGERTPNRGPRLQSSLGIASDRIQESSLTQGKNQPQQSHNIGSPPLFLPQNVRRGSIPHGGGAELERKRSPVVGNTMLEFTVPERIIGSVYGEGGSNLARLRQVQKLK